MTALLLALTLLGSPEPQGVDGLNRLQPRQMTASSALQNGWNSYEQNFLPSYAADDDPATAWVEGSEGDGVGEWLMWRGPELTEVKGLKLAVRNGFQRSKALFTQNVRIKGLKVTVLGANVDKDFTLADESGWQTIALPDAAKLTGLKLTITSVYPGTKYTDLCVSDVRVYATAKEPYKPEREAEAFEAIRAWTAERQKRAKQGLKPLPSYYLAEYKSGPVKDKAALIETATDALERLNRLKLPAPILAADWREARVSLQHPRDMDVTFLRAFEYWYGQGHLLGDTVFQQLMAVDLVAWDAAPKRPDLEAAKTVPKARNRAKKCREVFGDEPGLMGCEGWDRDMKTLVELAERRVHAVHGDLQSFDQVFVSDPGFYGERDPVMSEHTALVLYKDGRASAAVIDESAEPFKDAYREVFLFTWKNDKVQRVCMLTFKGEVNEKVDCASGG